MTGTISAIAGPLLLADQQRRASASASSPPTSPRPQLTIREIVPQDAATLEGASIVGRQLIAEYLVDAKSEVRTFTLDGAPHRHDRACPASAAPAASAATSRRARPSTASPATTAPARSSATTARPARTSIFAEPRLHFDPADYDVRQVFYPSKDGTRIPMFLMHRRGLDTRRPQPTLLYGYGGFDISSTPGLPAAAG